jgi:anti-sigma28 factor (negative regulator of flagellin synthesis)
VRDARASRFKSQMDESRTMKLHVLQERIERDEYEIDPRAVADALVAHLLSARIPSRVTIPRPTS